MAWTPEEFKSLLNRLRSNSGDFTDVEVKSAFGGCPDLKETLSAFGHMPEGGTIILGLSEAMAFSAVGLSNPAEIEAAVASQARTSVSPPVQVSFDRTKVDKKTVVIVAVAGLPSNDRPCRVRRGNHAYLRQSDGDYRMSEQEVQQILAARQRPRHDSEPVDDTSIKHLDTALLDHFIASAKAASRRLNDASDEDILRFKRVLEPTGKRLTLAGLYALGNYPQQFAPHLTITAVAESTVRGGIRNLDRMTFDGPLPEMLDRAIDWVQRNTRTAVRIGADGHGRDETEIPMVAVRELIANALVHRDLSSHTSGQDVHIRLTGSHLVITSPGGLWGLSQARLGLPGARSAVNEFLYDICTLTRTSSAHRVIEGEGGGLRDVGVALRDAGLRRPEYHDYGVRFTTLVPRVASIDQRDMEWIHGISVTSEVSELQKQILLSLRHGQIWSASMVQETFGALNPVEAESILHALATMDLANKTDGAHGPTYAIAPQLAAPRATTAPEKVVMETRQVEQPKTPRALRLPEAAGQELQQVPAPLPQSKNAELVWGALGGDPLQVESLVDRTGLTANQIRYALRPLIASGSVVRDGGQGHRGTTYSRYS